MKRAGEAPHAGHFLARSIEDARDGLSAALSEVDAITTGWTHIQDQNEDRVIARYLGSAAEMVAEITSTHAAIGPHRMGTAQRTSTLSHRSGPTQ